MTPTVEDKIIELAIEGLMTDGSHHKQWYLEKILETLGININQLQKEEHIEWEPGIPA